MRTETAKAPLKGRPIAQEERGWLLPNNPLKNLETGEAGALPRGAVMLFFIGKP
jgi:hypothetical protein